MNTYQGSELKSYIQDALEESYRKRFVYKNLKEYLTKPKTKEVCCLYGLRRTGKTVMMMQAIAELNDYDRSMYIYCTGNDSIRDLDRILSENKEHKYFFIDEATAMKDFINCAGVISDNYSIRGKKIVLAGTDSLSIMIAKGSSLYDRACIIHTTYISYKEHKFLLGLSLDDYIQYGGTLTDGKTIYNKDNIDEYTNTAIADNITHSIGNWDHEQKLGVLGKIYYAGEIPTFINKTIQISNRQFVEQIVNRSFVSRDIGSLKDIFTNRKRNDIADFLDNPELVEKIRGNLRILNHLVIPADDDNIKKLREYMVKLDLLYEIPGTDEVIFTQPGMRYCHVEEDIRSLMDMEEWDCLSGEDKEEIRKVLDNDVKGRIMEDIIFYEFSQHNLHVCRTDADLDGREIDIVLLKDNKLALIEVKHSSQITPLQRKHLEDKQFCKELEQKYHAEIVSKNVVYMGKSTIVDDGIRYLNAEKLLCNIEKYIGNYLFSPRLPVTVHQDSQMLPDI